MKKNVPDRVKLIIQFILFSIITMPLLAFFFALTFDGIDGRTLFRVTVLAAVTLQAIRFVKEWRKVLREEKLDASPDEGDLNNVDSYQLLVLLTGVFFLAAGSIIFAVYSKVLGFILFILCCVVWVIDYQYFKKKISRAQQKILGDAGSG